MWIAMLDGFFSVVQIGEDPTKAVVRAHLREDLVALLWRVPTLRRIYAGKGSDYPFRCFVSKAEFAQGLATAVTEGLTDGNYKRAVLAGDPERAAVLSQPWSVFRQFEKG